jgi:hypothetical protein
MIRHVVLLVLALLLAVVGYFLFGIVVTIYTGLLLHGEKMYYAQGLPAQLFGATGALLGVGVAWAVWRLGLALLGRPGRQDPA